MVHVQVQVRISLRKAKTEGNKMKVSHDRTSIKKVGFNSNKKLVIFRLEM